MGWGPDVPLALIATIESKNIPDDVKIAIYKDMIDMFYKEEWNTQDQCRYKSRCFDRALHLNDPSYLDDDGVKKEMIEKKGESWYRFVTTGK